MILTFGQYSTLTATRQCVTHDQLASKTEFDRMMVSYYVAVLVSNGLVTVKEYDDKTCYQLTEEGAACLEEYERYNPELTIRRAEQWERK